MNTHSRCSGLTSASVAAALGSGAASPDRLQEDHETGSCMLTYAPAIPDGLESKLDFFYHAIQSLGSSGTEQVIGVGLAGRDAAAHPAPEVGGEEEETQQQQQQQLCSLQAAVILRRGPPQQQQEVVAPVFLFEDQVPGPCYPDRFPYPSFLSCIKRSPWRLLGIRVERAERPAPEGPLRAGLLVCSSLQSDAATPAGDARQLHSQREEQEGSGAPALQEGYGLEGVVLHLYSGGEGGRGHGGGGLPETLGKVGSQGLIELCRAAMEAAIWDAKGQDPAALKGRLERRVEAWSGPLAGALAALVLGSQGPLLESTCQLLGCACETQDQLADVLQGHITRAALLVDMAQVASVPSEAGGNDLVPESDHAQHDAVPVDEDWRL